MHQSTTRVIVAPTVTLVYDIASSILLPYVMQQS